jgi:heat shock protein HslJ
MASFFEKIEDGSSLFVRTTRIFLLILIIIGIALLLTQKVWVPKLVDYILSFESEKYEVVKFNSVSDYKNTKYIIDRQSIKLNNGFAENEIAPGSASKTITQYFGNEVKYDFDKDGREDIAFLLTQETGGSGTFYYLVASLNKPNGYIGSSAFFLGDRIAPQTTEINNGKVVVNFAERKPGESFSVTPSIGKSVVLILDTETMQFGEVVKDFEGEADPAVMKLDMKKWNWVSTKYNDGKNIVPRTENKFTLTFNKPNNFSASTDCNGIGGEYILSGNKISFERMMSTMMFCENSQENDFSKSLGEVESYYFTSKGELIFNLKLDSGTMIFR